MKRLIEIPRADLQENTFEAFGADMALLCAGNKKTDFNMMTVSWGTFGILWNRPIATVFVRPQRHTYKFMESHDLFSVCIFDDEKYRNILSLCGSKSGKNIDKMHLPGLTPRFDGGGPVIFNEAHTAVVCRKLYVDDIDPKLFLLPELESYYPGKDYHRFYIGEIIRAYKLDY